MHFRLGADHLIDYKDNEGKFSEKIAKLTQKRGVNAIFDPVMSGPSFNENLKSLAQDSKWVIYGSMGGPKLQTEAQMVRLLMARASILTSTLRNRSDQYKSKLFQEVYDFYNQKPG